MPDHEYYDPQEVLRRHAQIRRGLDPDFHYTRYRFATVAAFRKNVPYFIDTFGINNLGVLLLTFQSHITVREARRRFNNIWRRFFREIFGHWICVVEFTRRGRIHFHILVECLSDIRTDFGFDEYRAYLLANEKAVGVGPRLTLRQRRALRDAIPANDFLRHCWSIGDTGIPSFGFGRVWDLFPIVTNEIGITRYLCKQFLSGLPLQLRLGRNKGARLISYSKGCPRAVPPGWRPPSDWFPIRLKTLLAIFRMSTRSDLQLALDRRWGYAVLRLCAVLENELGEAWPFWPIFLLAPNVYQAITRDTWLSEKFGTLLPHVQQTIIETTYPDVPPPPPSVPSSDCVLPFEPIEI